MCNSVGLEFVINYFKDAGFDPGIISKRSDYSWISVKIGDLYCLDHTTWGEGTFDRNIYSQNLRDF